MVDNKYSSKSEFSKAEIVRSQVLRCSELRSKEMRAGYWNYTSDGKKVDISDARKEWVSAVKTLRKLLEPEARKDKDFADFEKEFQEAEEEIFNKYSFTPKKKVWKIEGGKRKSVWVSIPNSKPYIPEKGAALFTDNPDAPNSIDMRKVVSLWDDYINLYWSEIVEIYDELFAELNVLIDKNKYFKQKVNYGFNLDDEVEEEDVDDEEY